ncbi:MAG: hypothetical protein IPI73_17365 [Betaproteobacteria bacterium]|nr:hypothetical protein [Betaproteobacteria bacterium]
MMIITGAAFAYPDRPMRLIVGFPAGGDTDVLARIMADAMAPILGHPIIVDNKPGADAQIAVSNLKNSPADGYSMMMVSVNFAAGNKKVYPELPYDQLNDFVPVVQIAETPTLLFASKTLGVDTFGQFVELAKNQPRKLNSGYTSATVNLTKQSAFESLMGISATPISYKGTPDLILALIRGDIAYALTSPIPFVSIVAERKSLRLPP